MRKKIFTFLLALVTSVGMMNAAVDGKLSGAFTVNAGGDQVYFSQGNLQYQGSTNTWRFAEHQYDFIGDAAGNNTESGRNTQSDWIDLFGWATSGNSASGTAYQPWQSSTTDSEYGPAITSGQWTYANSDWGINPISNGGNVANSWRTLTQEEWDYILNSRSTDYRFSYAKLNIGVQSYNGLIILPDDWNPSYYALSAGSMNQGNHSYDSNVISEEDWTNSLEAHGAVFLPASGIRTGNEVEDWYGDNSTGNYWTSFAVNDEYAFYLSIAAGWGVGKDATTRCKGLAVRLVYTEPSGDPTPTPGPTPSTVAVNGKLPGAFSVSADKQVYFSQGNLQYTKSTKKFSFMTNQYDMVETPDQNVGDDYADQDVVSLFGWGTSGWDNTSADATSVHYQPYATCNTDHGTDNNKYQYGPSNANVVGDESWSKSDDYKNYDWGVYNSGDLGADWRTLTAQEWKYLFSDRTNASNLRTLATVNGVKGVILMPDGWTAGDVSLTITMLSYETNTIDDDWETLEGQGCVFLPAARCRRGNTIDNSDFYSGCYWSSTSCGASAAYYVIFAEDYLDAPTNSSRWMGYSVRLVSETPPASTPDPTPATPSVSDEAANIEATFTSLLNTTTDVTINRTFIKNGYFNTICLPFGLATLDGTPLANGELYELTESEEDGGYIDLTLSKVTSLTAGKPYLIKWNYGEDITGPMTFNDVTIKASAGTTVTNTMVDFVGTIGRTTLTPGDQDYLFLGAENTLYYSASDDNTSMKGFRAYFIVKSSGKSALPHQAPARFVIAAPKTPTAVENVQGEVQGTKVLENGQLYIIKNGVKYNAQGKVVK